MSDAGRTQVDKSSLVHTIQCGEKIIPVSQPVLTLAREIRIPIEKALDDPAISQLNQALLENIENSTSPTEGAPSKEVIDRLAEAKIKVQSDDIDLWTLATSDWETAIDTYTEFLSNPELTEEKDAAFRKELSKLKLIVEKRSELIGTNADFTSVYRSNFNLGRQSRLQIYGLLGSVPVARAERAVYKSIYQSFRAVKTDALSACERFRF